MLALGRKIRQALYARNGLGEYWIVNLRDGRLEIQRDPKGDGYRSLAVLRRGDRVRPHASPDHGVAAADLLP
ncbi:MAG: Uma2 family endonuclease [Candidatus Competibacteraceae bacterium]|nr:Uma2 family endonuclease [Candidatus Competibacteraceae bacterium]